MIERCGYMVFSNNKLIHPDPIFTDLEPDSEPDDNDESEEEIHENTVFNE